MTEANHGGRGPSRGNARWQESGRGSRSSTQWICRRHFLQMAAAGLLVSCSPKQPGAASPTDPPTTSTAAPVPAALPKAVQPAKAYIGYCGWDGCPGCVRYGVSCDGCLTDDGLLFPTVVRCPVRNCSRERDIANCARCDDYSCDILDRLYAKWRGRGYGYVADRAEAALEEIRQSPSS
jgi:hypothetical protein